MRPGRESGITQRRKANWRRQEKHLPGQEHLFGLRSAGRTQRGPLGSPSQGGGQLASSKVSPLRIMSSKQMPPARHPHCLRLDPSQARLLRQGMPGWLLKDFATSCVATSGRGRLAYKPQFPAGSQGVAPVGGREGTAVCRSVCFGQHNKRWSAEIKNFLKSGVLHANTVVGVALNVRTEGSQPCPWLKVLHWQWGRPGLEEHPPQSPGEAALQGAQGFSSGRGNWGKQQAFRGETSPHG